MGWARGWKPEGQLLVTGTELADWLSVGQPALQSHLEAGRLVRVGQLYDLKASIRLYSAHMREVAAGRGNDEMADAKKRLDLARARVAEIRLAREEGELAPVAEMQRAMEDSYRKVRSSILAVPSRIRQLLGIGQHEAGVIDRELRDALARLGHADEGDDDED